MERIDKIKISINIVFRVLLIYAAVIALRHNSWINVTVSLSTLFLTFLPSVIEKRFKIDYPSEFEIVIMLFIYASIYLGDMRDFYLKFWWWDTMLHILSGIIFGTIGFSLIYILNRSIRLSLKLSPGFVAFFAFCFSLTAGTIWEIYEFLMDELFGMKLQRFGLNDTMWDMILDTLGATVVSAIGYRHIKHKIMILDKPLKRFIRFNPGLFKARKL